MTFLSALGSRGESTEGRVASGLAAAAARYRGPGSAATRRELSRAIIAVLKPDLEVRSLRNAARQYPCARPSHDGSQEPVHGPPRRKLEASIPSAWILCRSDGLVSRRYSAAAVWFPDDFSRA